MATKDKELVSGRVDTETRQDVKTLLNRMGMTEAGLINVVWHMVKEKGGIPFPITLNQSLDQAMSDLHNGNVQTFNSVDDLFEDLNDAN